MMQLLRLSVCFSLLGSALAGGRGALNAFKRHEKVRARMQEKHAKHILPRYESPAGNCSQYLTNKTAKFAVNGTGLPEVNFDVGESYAGLLPISGDANESRELFFWFFPSTNPDADEEITIWFNGGPGCSSLSGLLTENGPFLWQEGTLAPVANSYSWTNLTNMLWIEQPVGVGYSQGVPNITNEVELGQQLIGFYKQFVDTFDVYGYKVYLTGESYAGYYVPYIADAFIQADDLDYYNLAGIGINDPILGDEVLQQQVVLPPFVKYWQNLFYLNDSYIEALDKRSEQCNFTSYLEKYYTFPPPAESFPTLPDPFYSDTFECDLFDSIYEALLEVNPCFNIYHITQTCPFPSTVLGIINEGDYVQPGSQNYFNRSDVQAALHAVPGTNWMQCTDKNVFNYGYVNNYTIGDTSLGPAVDGTLQRVIEYLGNNTIIGVGNLDFILPPNGTLFALQNVTWNGVKGFQEYPQQYEFLVPYHPEYNQGRLSEAGIVGYWGEERGVLFYTVQLAGHELPGYAAGAGYRMLEKLLGRIDSLSDPGTFTTQTGNFTGNGTITIYKRDASYDGLGLY